MLDVRCIEQIYCFLDPDLYCYYCFAIYLTPFQRPLLQKEQRELENIEDSGYSSALLEAEDTPIGNYHSTLTKNEKVQIYFLQCGIN